MEDVKAEMIRGVEVTPEEKALYVQGNEVGKRWAETTAEDDELDRVKALRDSNSILAMDNGQSTSYSNSEEVFFVIDPESKGDRTAAHEFFEQWFDDEDEDEEEPTKDEVWFLLGFAEAAADARTPTP